MSLSSYNQKSVCVVITMAIITLVGFGQSLFAGTAPSTYTAYTGTDAKVIPSAPTLGPANSIINDPTFGSRILRVTDSNTLSGNSLMPEYAGFYRTWNADSTALKLMNSQGYTYWLEFNASTFTVGDGSSKPTVHPLPFPWTWEWSAVDPDSMYFLNGTQLAKYNKTTHVVTNLGGHGVPLTYHVAVVGADAWICSAAGPSGSWRYSMMGSSTLTTSSKRSNGTSLCGPVRGIAGLISAITRRADRTAARVMSTDTPRLHIPLSSGGLA